MRNFNAFEKQLLTKKEVRLYWCMQQIENPHASDFNEAHLAWLFQSLPWIKLGGKIYYAKSDIDAWLIKHR